VRLGRRGGLNEALLAKAAEAKVLRCSRVRVDTTVVPSNVSYPTDSGLLAKAVNRIAATGRRIRAAGGRGPHLAAGPFPCRRATGS
jgi:IS5 family transposase